MFRTVLTVLLIAGLVATGCSNKDEDIAAIEQEASQDETAAVMDSLLEGSTEADSTGQFIAEVVETQPVEPEVTPASEDYSGLEGFVVQIGSYSSYEFAEMMAEKYRQREYPAFVVTADIGGETFYRLRVGVYETMEEAKQIGELLKDRYTAEYWVDSNR
ncbi:MAG: SPOR domain-containing protein [FCB group bacterium]|nr:SPOR domain-containing protein [FCB group bacterium]